MSNFILSLILVLSGCGALNDDSTSAKNGGDCNEEDGFLQAKDQHVFECKWNGIRYTDKTTSRTWSVILTCPDAYQPVTTKNNKKYFATCRNTDGDFYAEGSNGWVFCSEKDRPKWFEVHDAKNKQYQYFQCLDDTPRGTFGEPWGVPTVDAEGRYTKYGGPYIICEDYKKATLTKDRTKVKCR